MPCGATLVPNVVLRPAKMEVLLSSVGLIFFDVQPRNPGGVFWSSFGVLFVLFGGALVPCGVTLVPNWCQIGCYGHAKIDFPIRAGLKTDSLPPNSDIHIIYTKSVVSGPAMASVKSVGHLF